MRKNTIITLPERIIKKIWKFIRKVKNVTEQINWIEESIKALITSIMIILLSTAFVWLIYQNSPGDFEGEKLDHFLLGNVAKNIGIPNNSDYLRMDNKCISESMTVICGKYKETYDEYGYSCFVYVFDRKEKNFWNVLVNTNPGYHVALGLLLVDASLDYDSIIFEDCQFEDINEDMQEEIIVHYRLRFADRVDNLVAVIQNHDNEWELITPDFSLVEEELRQMGYEDCRVLWDEFSLYDVNKKEAKSIFCAFNLSGITIVENPLWGGNDWMYSATVDDGTTGTLSANHFVFIMERITDNGFDREPNWNGGLVKYCSLDQLENFDLENEWGVSTGNVRFFGGDVD